MGLRMDPAYGRMILLSRGPSASRRLRKAAAQRSGMIDLRIPVEPLGYVAPSRSISQRVSRLFR